jgi:mono/diheme cytochrome c family protein
VGGFDLRGPFNPQGVGDTESRRSIFVCYPKEATEQAACAKQIITRLATRAWRGPVTEAAVNDLLGFYRQGAELRDFDTGVQYALARILSDPRFVYRLEHEPEEIRVGDSYAINGHELASRLSFFLWSSIPDDELLRAAGAGELGQAKKVEQQIDRMLADPRADALVQNFAAQWLGLRQLATIDPTSTEYDGTLRESMKRETELLFSSILREDRSVLGLLNADYTFVDERLARHYGIAHIQGSQFRRVPVSDANRRGILGHASVLTLTSAPNRTSPVKRGQWVLENLLGTPPPPPPPGVEVKLDQPPEPGAAPATLRQRLEQHRANPSCGACHGVIDPIGIALENFDAIGKWRDTAEGQPVDAVTALWDGTPLHGAADLRRALLARSPEFVEAVAEKLLAYGLGRKVEYADMPAVRSIVRDAKPRNYKLKALIKGVALSPAFRQRVKQPTPRDQLVVQEH